MSVHGFSFFANLLRVLIYDESTRCHPSDRLVNLPHQTHRYLLEPFSGFRHLFSLLTNRFLKFYATIYHSDKAIIQNLRLIQESDCRSTFAINIRNICRSNNVNNIFDCKKNGVKYFPIDENELWRVNFLKDLCDCNEFLTENELKDIINYVACN